MVLEYIKKYKKEIEESIEDLKHKETFYKQIPNLLTFLRLIGGLPAGFIYFLNPYVSIGVISFLWFTDAIDGRIARKLKIQSKLGADMDTVADKIMFLASALPLLVSAPLLVINFVLEGIISTINVTGRIKGLNTKTVLSGKVKTVSLALTLIAGYFVQFFGISVNVLNSLISITTVLQFLAIKDYIIQYIKMDMELKKITFDNENEEDMLQHDLLVEDKALNKTLFSSMHQVEELKSMKTFILETQEHDTLSKFNKRTRNIKNERKKNNE